MERLPSLRGLAVSCRKVDDAFSSIELVNLPPLGDRVCRISSRSREVYKRALGFLEARKNTSGLALVVTILIAEKRDHHPLFTGRTHKVHQGKCHHCRPPGQPVLQQQPLPEIP